jgi:hypothetical protein
MMRPLLLALWALPSTAFAGWPDDLSVSGLGSWQGTEVGPETASEAWSQVALEMGAAIANKPMAPAETPGANGFDVAFTNTVAFIDQGTNDPDSPSAWERMHSEGDPSGSIWMPAITARKGLPMSLELGSRFGYIAFPRQAIVGGWGRVALVEGYRQYPDVAVQLGYSAYVGNDELDIGAMDSSLTLGYTVPFGRLKGINAASWSPYAGVGMLRIHATPQLDPSELETLGVKEISPSDEGGTAVQIHAGFRLQSGNFQILMSGTGVPGSIFTASMGLGYVY